MGLTATALATLKASPRVEQIFNPGARDSAIQDVAILASILVGSFIAGLLHPTPASKLSPAMDRIWVVASTLALAFWIPGLLFGAVLAFHSIDQSGGYLVARLLVAASSVVFGGIVGALSYGAVGYPVGVAMLWLLREIEYRWTAEQAFPEAAPSARRRASHVFLGAIATITALISSVMFFGMSFMLAATGLAYLKLHL